MIDSIRNLFRRRQPITEPLKDDYPRGKEIPAGSLVVAGGMFYLNDFYRTLRPVREGDPVDIGNLVEERVPSRAELDDLLARMKRIEDKQGRA